jgi:hypothetical protein
MRLEEAEMWFHNRFLACNRSGRSAGSEPIHGKIHAEGETHLIVYSQPMGHGVRCAQRVDAPGLRRFTKILRLRGDRPRVPFRADHATQVDVTYDLKSFDAWYERARPPFRGEPCAVFEEVIPLGRYPDGRPLQIARFISGADYAVGSWSRPKPMWSWDDGWDNIPIFVWHFFPSVSFESHIGTPLSDRYVYNRPASRVFQMSAAELRGLIQLELETRDGDKWKFLEHRWEHIPRDTYWLAIRKGFKRYLNYLFHALG